MNKARMTIRFDRETPGEGVRDIDSEAAQSGSIPHSGAAGRRGTGELGWPQSHEAPEAAFHHENKYENSRVVQLPIELLQNRVPDPHAPEGRSEHVHGRLAEERRRLEQAEIYNEHPVKMKDKGAGGFAGDLFNPDDFVQDDRVPPYEVNLKPPDEGDWDQTYHSHGQKFLGTPEDYSYYRSRKPTSAWKVAAAITGAVVTGLLFGAVVLSMFNGGEEAEKGSAADLSIQNPIAEQTANNGGITRVDGTEEVPAASVAVAIPEQTFYMLQYGVFSTAERAEQAKGELTSSGIAAFAEVSDENRVYAGVSPDREQAKLLSSQLKNSGVELYVREITMPGAQSAVFAGDAAALDIFFEASANLAGALSSLSASLLGMETPSPADAETMKTVTNLHLQWTESIKLVASGMSPETGANLTKMEQEMNGAITALTEYNKNRSKGHLWEIQAGMMNYIMSQRKLVESL